MAKTQRSFIREILKVTEKPEIISFAGGLPHPRLFPIREISRAAARVLRESGEQALQYSTTEGFPPLREFIAARYRRKDGMAVRPEDILILSGSQQGIDLVSKALLDPGDRILIERPAYLGALQSFALFEPEFLPLPLEADGVNLPALEKALARPRAKIFHTVPNFQNPSGITYSRAKRRRIADLVRPTSAFVVEDDPYRELRFLGEDLPPIRKYLGDRAILFGSFSKIVSPGLRVGWVLASPEVMEQLVIAKQASDLHTNTFSQRIIHRYLLDHDLDDHIRTIRRAYKNQRDVMVAMLERHFPPEAQFTRPEGGMFLWVTLPPGCSVQGVFEAALREKVAFVPGNAFFVDDEGSNSFRLNFSNTSEAKIRTGIRRLARAVKRQLQKSGSKGS
ncbi:MAG: PLP-dependent aminotransferase family protein [bacterium]|nr:PLP-dependent aminotransferase family protein [bacterium]